MLYRFERKWIALMLSLLILLTQIGVIAFADVMPDHGSESDTPSATSGVTDKDEHNINDKHDSSGGDDSDVASSGVTEANHAPTVKAGQETQTGSAYAAEKVGEEVPYTADLSDWFEDEDGDPLIYEVADASGGSLKRAVVDGDMLTYTPSFEDIDTTVMIVVKANDGVADSTGHVTVMVDVSEAPMGIAPMAAPSGYITDANDMMAYRYLPGGNYDLKGKFNGEWKQITFGSGGFSIYFLPSSGAAVKVWATGNAETVTGVTGVTVKTSFAFVDSGKALKIIYEVTNGSSSAVSYSLGSAADVMIGNDDSAVIQKSGTNGFTTTSRMDEDKNALDEYTQFKFIGRNNAHATNVDEFWYGAYHGGDDTARIIDAFNVESNCGYSSYGTPLLGVYDSAMGYSWQGRTIAAGATQTYSTVFGITGAALPPEFAPIKWESAVADGHLDTVTSTKIDLTFDKDIALYASSITVTNLTGSVVKGVLTGSGKNWSLALPSVAAAGTVRVAIANSSLYAVSGSPYTVTVHKALPTVEFLSATANGVRDTETSTKIDLAFDAAISGLTASRIAITNGTGTVTKGSTVTGAGANWSISLADVAAAGEVGVAISGLTGYNIIGSPQTATVHRAATPEALVSAIADGEYNKTDSTKIDLVFGGAIADLDDSNIVIVDDTGSVVKGALSGFGTNWSIALSGVTTAGDVIVYVSNVSGFTISGSPKIVTVHKAPVPVVLQSAEANGTRNTAVSTKIDLVFDTAVTGLRDSDVVITDVTGSVLQGALSGSGKNWSIALTDVVTAGEVKVAVSSPVGYAISGSPKTVTVHKVVETGDVSGTVTEEDTSPIPRVTVMVTKGGTYATPVATTYTDLNGNYSFFGLEYGTYSLIATVSDGQSSRTVTRHLVVDQASMTLNIQMPVGNQNTIVEVMPNTPSVAAENLEAMFEKGDRDAATTGGSVEIKLTVEKVASPADADVVTQARGDRTLGLYLDAKLTKTVVKGIIGTASGTYRIQPPETTALKLILDVPPEHRNKSGYKVIRVHNGVAREFDAEYDSALHTLHFEADLFSTYAIIYDSSIQPPNPPARQMSTSKGDSVQPSSNWIEVPEADSMAKNARNHQLDYARSNRASIIGIRKDSLLLLADSGLRYQHDMVENSVVQVRLYANTPEQASKDIHVRSALSGDRVNAVKAKFAQISKKPVAVISMEQLDNFAFAVQIAARVDLSGMDTRNLYFYSYNQTTNEYTRIETEYRIDSKDYLHFATVLAGSIVISDGPLKGGAVADEAFVQDGIDNPATGGAPVEIRAAEHSAPLTIDASNPGTGETHAVFVSGGQSGTLISKNDSGTTVSAAQSLPQPSLTGPIVSDNARAAHRLNMLAIVVLTIAAALVVMILWAFIPRKSDEWVDKASYRKK